MNKDKSEDIEGGYQAKLPSESKPDFPDHKATNDICPSESEKNRKLKELFDRLWGAADELRANSRLRSTQYSTPVLGILFLRYADYKFKQATEELKKKHTDSGYQIRKLDYQASGIIYLTEKDRYEYLLQLPEGANIGKAIDDAMRNIENQNEELRDVLPKVYANMEDKVLINLLRLFHIIPTGLDQDIFGKIYEYFLGKFAMSEGQRGGEFYTPTSIVRLIVEVIEPYHGRILDPACGSGGMFVQSAEFVKDHLRNPYEEISIYGQEKAEDTVRLCKMNLAIHGLSGDIRQGNTYYEDVFNMRGQFDFVMANPPFNVNNVDKEATKVDPRYTFGMPSADNANYLWIQIFCSMLKEDGRAGFVMANIASDSGYSELEMRKKLVENDAVDVVISVASNFFYTVALPVTLWFLKKEKKNKNDQRRILFIDARKIFNQIDRRHREFTSQQIEFISDIVRLYRKEEIETRHCSKALMEENFPSLKYKDVKGLCKAVIIEEIERQNWSLNPGRYVDPITEKESVVDFKRSIKDLFSELELLNARSQELEKRIMDNMQQILGEN
jgi:type I restriction enzyme M protein